MSNTHTPIDPVDPVDPSDPSDSVDRPSEHDPFGSWAKLTSDPIPPRRPESTRRPSRSRTWITTGAAAATLGIGGYFGVGALASHTRSVANASTSTGGPQGAGGFPSGAGGGPPGGGGTVGTIKSISGSSLTVLTRSGATDTVDFSSATTITKSTTGSVSDIKVGDHLVVNGTGTSTVSATSITDGGTSNLAGGQGGPGGAAPPTGSGTSAAAGGTSSSGSSPAPPSGQFGGGSFVQGTVTAVGSGSITIKETSGTTATVTTSSSTTVTVLETITASDLQAGQTVSVQGTTANGVVTATSIREGAAFGG